MRNEPFWRGRPSGAGVLMLVALPWMAACGTVDEAGEDEAGVVLSQQCTNPRHGFTVSYPHGWHTNRGDVVPRCTAFDPEPFDLPPASEMPFDIAVVIDVEEVRFERVASSQASRWERILSAERLTLAGHEAWRVEAEATGEGLAPPGMRSLRYVLDLGEERSLVATTHQTDGAEYLRNKDLLGQMVQSLDVPSPAS